MRRIITLISAVALATGLLTGVAAADTDPTLAELQAAYDDAQGEVERLEAVVVELEGQLALARGELGDAIADRDAKKAEVERLEGELAAARTALRDAEEAQATIEGLLIGLGDTYKDGECNNRSGDKRTCDQYLTDLSAAVAEVAAKTSAFEAAEGALETAQDELIDLEAAVVTATGEVERLEGELKDAEADLEVAEQLRDEAKEALDTYVPPVDSSGHAGCKGVENAQQQVAKNSKGKGAEALDKVAAKLGC